METTRVLKRARLLNDSKNIVKTDKKKAHYRHIAAPKKMIERQSRKNFKKKARTRGPSLLSGDQLPRRLAYHVD
jgi:hypothetical protein